VAAYLAFASSQIEFASAADSIVITFICGYYIQLNIQWIKHNKNEYDYVQHGVANAIWVFATVQVAFASVTHSILILFICISLYSAEYEKNEI
jgi:hypothetical protein